jgi:hypothetical protein
MKGLEAIAYKRAVEGKVVGVHRNLAQLEQRASPTDVLLKMLHKQGDPSDADAAALANSVLTWNEWQAHIRFNQWGEKYDAADPRAAELALMERQEKVLRRLRNYAAAGGGCPCCRQQLPEGWPRGSIMEMQVLGVVNIWDHRDGWGALGPTRTRPDPVDIFIPPLT